MTKKKRSYIYFLEDIYESIESILLYTDSYTFEHFRNDKKTVDAVMRNLEFIGEASNKISLNIKVKYP